MPDNLKNIWQSNLDEIKANKLRFTAIVALFVVSIALLFNDSDSNAEKITLNIEPKIETTENIDTINIVPTENLNVDKNITAVTGASDEILYVYDPFKVEPENTVEPEIQSVNLPQMALQQPPPFWLSYSLKNLLCAVLLLSAKIKPHSFKRLHQIRPKIF